MRRPAVYCCSNEDRAADQAFFLREHTFFAPTGPVPSADSSVVKPSVRVVRDNLRRYPIISCCV